ncbi:MAG: hypothetical protein ACE5EU_00385 [Paracoccaceae bacterium]
MSREPVFPVTAGDNYPLADDCLAAAKPLERLYLPFSVGDLAPNITVEEHDPATCDRGSTFDQELDIPVAQATLADTPGSVFREVEKFREALAHRD